MAKKTRSPEASVLPETPGVDTAETTLETAASEWGADPVATGYVAAAEADASADTDASDEALAAKGLNANRDENGDWVSAELSLAEASALLAAEEAARHLADAAEPVVRDDADFARIEAKREAAEDAVSHRAVAFIASPSGFADPRELAEAQESDEPLALDTDLDSDLDPDFGPALGDREDDAEETFGRLEERMAAETQALTDAANAAAERERADAGARLAEQIAEDRALERAIAEEAAIEDDPELRAALPSEPSVDDYGNLDLAELESCIEALLFMSEKPLGAAKLRELLGPELALEHFDAALASLTARYAKRFHGFELVEVAHGFQFRTKPARAALAKKLAKTQLQRLSTGAMESLAIIAYKQPVLKDDVDKIRGVDSSHFIRGLLEKKLIKIAGRSELPGRPMLYETTPEFLELFALKSLASLPALQELEAMVPGSQSDDPERGDPRVKKMRALVSEMNLDDSVSLLYDPKEDDAFLSDIRQRVKSIEIVTPTLQAQNEEAEAAKAAAKARAKAIADGIVDPQAESFAGAIERAEPGETARLPIE